MGTMRQLRSSRKWRETQRPWQGGDFDAMKSAKVCLVAALGLMLSLMGGCATEIVAEPVPVELRLETVLEAPLGEGPGELGARFVPEAEPQVPVAFAVTGKAVLILDTIKDRIVEYREGRLSRTVPVPDLIEGRSLAVDREGDWYVYDPVGNVVIRLSAAGSSIEKRPVPDPTLLIGVPFLKQDADDRVILAVSGDEYDLRRPPTATPGLSFPGVRGRHTVDYADRHTAFVCIDGRRKWQVRADGELVGVTPLGYNGRGNLVVQAHDLSLNRQGILYVMTPAGRVLKAVLDCTAFETCPAWPLVIGGDGELYRLGFTRNKALLQRIKFEPLHPGSTSGPEAP